MSNSYNITTSNLGLDSEKLFLHHPALYLDFHDGNGLLRFAYMDKEFSWKIAREYAKFTHGVPANEIRRDLISQEFNLESKCYQIQPETVALLSQAKVDDTDPDWTRVVHGSDIVATLFPSAVLIGKNVNNREARLYIRRLQIAPEDFEMLLGGTEYSNIPLKGIAQKDETPLITNPDWDYNAAYGDLDNIAFWKFAKTSSSSSS